MEEISFHGNNLSFFCGAFVLLTLAIIGFSAYRSKRLAEINLINKEVISFEANLEKMNQQEIEGIAMQ